MKNKREVRLAYYEGIRSAMFEYIEVTEERVRRLEGVQPAKLDKIVADLHKHHQRLLKRIDQHIQEEKIDANA